LLAAGRRFGELGYQYVTLAMISLVIGLGGILFYPIKEIRRCF
jgi:hypothetical protein